MVERSCPDGVDQVLLIVYRHAIDYQAEHPAEVEVLSVAQGTIFDLACDVCGDVRTWHREDRPRRKRDLRTED